MLLGKAIAGRRDEVLPASKLGIEVELELTPRRLIDGSPLLRARKRCARSTYEQDPLTLNIRPRRS
jgi:hypothetical protein